MRLASIQRYDTWIPQLESATGRRIPFNRQGILRLCFEGEDLAFWKNLAEVRKTQGWTLEVYDRSYLSVTYPQLNLDRVIGAVYSPQDRQVDPTALTLALVDAATKDGVEFIFNTEVVKAEVVEADLNRADHTQEHLCLQIHTLTDTLPIDWLIIASGLGTVPLTKNLQQSVDIRPVLGQAIHLKLEAALGNPEIQPVITGEDVHIVPLRDGEYWVGATVEFPAAAETEFTAAPQPNPTALEAVLQQAIALCPGLADATILRTWSGLRPRPEGRPAPIIEKLSGYQNVLLATGHYRNGVLLAPATAEKIRQMIIDTIQH